MNDRIRLTFKDLEEIELEQVGMQRYLEHKDEVVEENLFKEN